jgi:hypothetical protein
VVLHCEEYLQPTAGCHSLPDDNHRDADLSRSAGRHGPWELVPERVAPIIAVPLSEKLRRCFRYREALDRELTSAPKADFEYE